MIKNATFLQYYFVDNQMLIFSETLVNYGYGFFITGGGNSERLFFHTGGWPGYSSIIMHFPDLQKAVVILSNNEYSNFTRIADDITELLIGN